MLTLVFSRWENVLYVLQPYPVEKQQPGLWCFEFLSIPSQENPDFHSEIDRTSLKLNEKSSDTSIKCLPSKLKFHNFHNFYFFK